ncbi:hypothetical protein [Terracidiphilus gabretensis]|uniref:hypothetical protein n=1 Tax=Terracidiphilus gabretensis TaxID=1577687 RepID=UPI00071BFFC1|nr:hypothetical protein [Terracidiphilus gabretensis]
MDRNRRLISLTVLALAATLALNGCKKSEAPQANNPQQPAATPAPGSPDQSAASQPGAPASPSGQPAPAAVPAPTPGAAGQAAAPVPPPPPPQPTVVVLPTGTKISVRLDQDLGSKISQPGQSFAATVSKAVIVDGQTIIPVGARAAGTVTDAKALGKIKGEARLSVRLDKVRTKWGSYPVATGSIDQVEKGKGKRTAVMGGGGAGVGAIIGGIAGGGKGALIGGLVGGGAGTATGAFTGNKQIVLPAETVLVFKLEHSVKVVQEP